MGLCKMWQRLVMLREVKQPNTFGMLHFVQHDALQAYLKESNKYFHLENLAPPLSVRLSVTSIKGLRGGCFGVGQSWQPDLFAHA